MFLALQLLDYFYLLTAIVLLDLIFSLFSDYYSTYSLYMLDFFLWNQHGGYFFFLKLERFSFRWVEIQGEIDSYGLVVICSMQCFKILKIMRVIARYQPEFCKYFRNFPRQPLDSPFSCTLSFQTYTNLSPLSIFWVVLSTRRSLSNVSRVPFLFGLEDTLKIHAVMSFSSQIQI